MKKDLGFGYCGLVCALCSENEHCAGCKMGGCPGKDRCKNYQCCTTKGYQYCYECPDFPCSDSILHKKRVANFCKIIEMYEEDKILDALMENENKGIKYHYSDTHLGDYDACETVEELGVLLFGEDSKK